MSWAGFFDEVLQQGTNVQHFRVELPSRPIHASIRVTAGASEIDGWKYEPGSTALWLPRIIPAGAKVRLSYERDDAPPTGGP